MDQYSTVKLGKVSKDLQRKLNVDFSSDDKVYILEKELDVIASSDPDGYLAKIHEASFIIREPDIVFFDAEKNLMHFVKLYFINEMFRIVGVSCHKDGQFYFDKMYVLNDKTKYETFEGLEGVIV